MPACGGTDRRLACWVTQEGGCPLLPARECVSPRQVSPPAVLTPVGQALSGLNEPWASGFTLVFLGLGMWGGWHRRLSDRICSMNEVPGWGGPSCD